MSKQNKYHYIYKTTCLITGKFYVGMHSTANLEDGYLGSGKILGYSRAKYGDENHIKEILEYANDRKSLALREKEIVNKELLKDPLNINLKYGGDGGGKFKDAEHQQKCSSAGGKKGGKIAIKILHDSEYRKKAMASRKLNNSLFNLGMLGKTHSDEVKYKMSMAQTGISNSQFGTCWVINELGPRKIKKELLEEHLNMGFRKGRI